MPRPNVRYRGHRATVEYSKQIIRKLDDQGMYSAIVFMFGVSVSFLLSGIGILFTGVASNIIVMINAGFYYILLSVVLVTITSLILILKVIRPRRR